MITQTVLAMALIGHASAISVIPLLALQSPWMLGSGTRSKA